MRQARVAMEIDDLAKLIAQGPGGLGRGGRERALHAGERGARWSGVCDPRLLRRQLERAVRRIGPPAAMHRSRRRPLRHVVSEIENRSHRLP
jgi:hypothetical protein